MATESFYALPGFASLSAVMTGTGRAMPANDASQVNWFVTYTVAPSAGTLIIEWALTETYAGKWQELDSISLASLSAGSVGSGSYPSPVGFVRARFSVDSDQAITAYLNKLINTAFGAH